MADGACRLCLSAEALAAEPVARNAGFVVLPKPHPTNPAALIVAIRHVASPFDFGAAEWAALGEAMILAQQHLAQFAPDGLTIGWNVGAAAGQHIFHAHLHVICRYDRNANAGRGLRDFVLR